MAAELRSLTVHIDTGRWSETVLTDVNLSIPTAEITVLLGGPGAGKTMLAYALTRRLPDTAQSTGQILTNGTVGYIPQDGIDAFTSERTVGDQLHALEHQHDGWTVAQACTAAHYPTDALELLPAHNSAGQIQRAAVAAALIPAPDILIADGATASLDRGTAYGVWKSLREYADSGAAVLAVTGDVPLLAATGHADRLVIVEQGRIVAAGTMAELLESADPRVQMYFRRGF